MRSAVSVGGYLGVGDEDGLGFVPVVEVGAGAEFNPAAPAVDYAVGWEVIHADDEEIALRVGLRLHARWVFSDVDGETSRAIVETVAAGSFGALRQYHLSVELRAGLGGEGGFDSPDLLGTFALSLVYDRMTTWQPLDEF